MLFVQNLSQKIEIKQWNKDVINGRAIAKERMIEKEINKLKTTNIFYPQNFKIEKVQLLCSIVFYIFEKEEKRR